MRVLLERGRPRLAVHHPGEHAGGSRPAIQRDDARLRLVEQPVRHCLFFSDARSSLGHYLDAFTCQLPTLGPVPNEALLPDECNTYGGPDPLFPALGFATCSGHGTWNATTYACTCSTGWALAPLGIGRPAWPCMIDAQGWITPPSTAAQSARSTTGRQSRRALALRMARGRSRAALARWCGRPTPSTTSPKSARGTATSSTAPASASSGRSASELAMH